MCLINDIILSSATKYGYGQLRFDEYSSWVRNRIKKINRRQRQVWKNKQIISRHALIIVWHLGIHFAPSIPNNSMNLRDFVDLLWRHAKLAENLEESRAALSLYIETMKGEMMQSIKRRG
jgi:hypothetical protein